MMLRRTAENDAEKKGLLHSVGIGLSAGFLGLVILLALATVVIPKATGSTPLTILTSSMEPTLPPGTLIIVKPTPANEVQVGDVVTYQFRSGNAAVVTHRVISISNSSSGGRTFITQGDNNANPDAEMVPEQLRGVVWYSVPHVGWVSTYVHGEDRGWLISAVAVLLLAYAAYMLTSGVIEARRARGAAGGKEDSEPRRPAPGDTQSDGSAAMPRRALQ